MSWYADYEPWTEVEDLRVALVVEGRPAEVGLPWVYGVDAQAVITTAEIVAGLNVYAFRARFQSQQETLGERVRAVKYNPPRETIACPGCKDSWDAWVNEDGTLEDPRDANCSTEKCPRRGLPGFPVRE